MFNNKRDNEADFCESYKSQILNDNTTEKTSSFNIILKVLTILLLLAIIVAVSIYGYNYFANKKSADTNTILPPISVQISDDDLKITEETPAEVEEEQKKVPTIQKIEEADIDQIANDVKIAIANSEKEEENNTVKEIESKVEEEKKVQETKLQKDEESLEIPTSSPEAQYLEELADLSKEIDKRENNLSFSWSAKANPTFC